MCRRNMFFLSHFQPTKSKSKTSTGSDSEHITPSSTSDCGLPAESADGSSEQNRNA